MFEAKPPSVFRVHAQVCFEYTISVNENIEESQIARCNFIYEVPEVQCFTECRDGKCVAKEPRKSLCVESSKLSDVPRVGVDASSFHVF